VSGAAVVADPPPPPQAARIMARAAKSAITRFICLLLAFSAPPDATVCDAGAHYRNRLKRVRVSQTRPRHVPGLPSLLSPQAGGATAMADISRRSRGSVASDFTSTEVLVGM